MIVELLSSESVYKNALGAMVNHYMIPAKTILSSLEINAIFSLVDCLYDFHASLLSGLEERINQWGPNIMIGSYLLQMSVFFRSYSAYVNNYTTAIQTLADCENENPEFAKFLVDVREETYIDGVRIQSLYSYLIMPIQRIPRYLLLLRDLKRLTDPEHPDYGYLEKTIVAIADIAEYIDAKRSVFEKSQRLTALSMVFSNLPPDQPFLKMGRQLVLDEDVELANESRMVRFMLCNDAIFVAHVPEKRDPRALYRSNPLKKSKRSSLRGSAPDQFQGGEMIPSSLEFLFCISLQKPIELTNYYDSFCIRDIEKDLAYLFRTPSKAKILEALGSLLEYTAPISQIEGEPEIANLWTAPPPKGRSWISPKSIFRGSEGPSPNETRSRSLSHPVLPDPELLLNP